MTITNSEDDDSVLLLQKAGLALQRAAAAFQACGVLLCHEDKAAAAEDSAGRILSRAGDHLHQAGSSLRQLQLSSSFVLHEKDARGSWPAQLSWRPTLHASSPMRFPRIHRQFF